MSMLTHADQGVAKSGKGDVKLYEAPQVPAYRCPQTHAPPRGGFEEPPNHHIGRRANTANQRIDPQRAAPLILLVGIKRGPIKP